MPFWLWTYVLAGSQVKATLNYCSTVTPDQSGHTHLHTAAEVYVHSVMPSGTCSMQDIILVPGEWNRILSPPRGAR